MSHGWFVVAISIYGVWKQREKLRVAEKRFSTPGLFMFSATLLVICFGSRESELYIRQISFVGLQWALIYTFFGWGFSKELLFPVCFLLFAVNIPVFNEKLVMSLQELSSSAAYFLMHGFCFDLVKEGTSVSSSATADSAFHFEIAEVCSGIRSLQAMASFTAAYAWHTQKTIYGKWLLFFCSIPIAVLCNMFRIFSLCLVAALFGQEAAIGYYHDYSGYVIVFVGFLMIFQGGVVIRKWVDLNP